ncbi:response regulator transcription factor [Paenibacillus turpanensis]|uniref:response regulator transcription factor n=1 Tax=Paenibacillus turpanensis TaxID=2689078 RepID=UPI00140A0100|nr:response regulator [Paenibacillus turpanensis]
MKFRILIVDDEKWVRSVIRKMVEKTGLPFTVVHECANGVEALDWLQEHTADLLLADIRMPVMDGLSFIEQLGAKAGSTDVAIISGHDDFEYARQAIRLGVVDYLLKPVDEQDMRKMLTKWMGRRAESEKETVQREIEDCAGLSPVEKVMQYIGEHMTSGEITLQDAAKHVHLNPSYLSQLFKQQTGQNFVDYVTGLRMKEAQKWLRHTSLRIAEIAERLGYSDQSYFSNQFRKWTGYTPSEYRKTAQSVETRAIEQ